MSDLQLSLIGLGVALVAGVFAYNKWQERKHRKMAESVFRGNHPDVLLGRKQSDPAENDGSAELRIEPGTMASAQDGEVDTGQATARSELPAMEAKELLEARDIQIDAMRVKAFPFNESVKEFIDSHDRIFVVEQNRDGQLRSLLISEFVMNSNKLVSVLNYDGFPITADLIRQKIYENLIGKLDPGFIEHEIAEPTDTDISE